MSDVLSFTDGAVPSRRLTICHWCPPFCITRGGQMFRVWPGSRCAHCGGKYPGFAESSPARLSAQQHQRRLQGSVAAATAPPDVSRQAEPAKKTQKKPHRRRPGPAPGRPQLSRRQEKRAATDLPVRIGKVLVLHLQHCAFCISSTCSYSHGVDSRSLLGPASHPGVVLRS